MKRLVTAVIILVLSLVLTVAGYYYTKNSLTEILSMTDSGSSELYGKWQEEKEMLAVLLKHEDIDNVDKEIENMKRYSETGNNEEKENCAVRARGYIIGILEGEKLSFGNVF